MTRVRKSTLRHLMILTKPSALVGLFLQPVSM